MHKSWMKSFKISGENKIKSQILQPLILICFWALTIFFGCDKSASTNSVFSVLWKARLKVFVGFKLVLCTGFLRRSWTQHNSCWRLDKLRQHYKQFSSNFTSVNQDSLNFGENSKALGNNQPKCTKKSQILEQQWHFFILQW